MEPLPHQIEGAKFLAARQTALLADAPRVGKTGAALLAAQQVNALRMDIVTTASGRAVWRKALRDWWPGFAGEARIWSWGETPNLTGPFHPLLIVDESHYAKNPGAKRTQAVYGKVDLRSGQRVWCLSGTPAPNAPNDLWSMLRALAPARLAENVMWPDVTDYEDFLHRYCVVKKRHLSRWKSIRVVIGGRNETELRDRLRGFILRRTQEDIGITQPIYDLLPIAISAAERKAIAAEVEDGEAILEAAEVGETKSLEIELSTLRRITGAVKARGVAQAVKDEMECGLDRVVLMCWHREVMDALAKALSTFGVVRLDGSTSANGRAVAERDFRDGKARVFIGQMLAAGEAIDLSASAELIFAESSFVPKDMAQAALRITNVGQQRQPRVRVAALEGSLDEALQSILLRKVATLRKVIS